jgi:hypothetical protein
MGVYAQTNIEVECETKKVAKEVEKVLKAMHKKSDEHGNSFVIDAEADGSSVFGEMSSGRVQNLEWQCEQVWEKIKSIKGVVAFNCPFLIEGDGMYFSHDE